MISEAEGHTAYSWKNKNNVFEKNTSIPKKAYLEKFISVNAFLIILIGKS